MGHFDAFALFFPRTIDFYVSLFGHDFTPYSAASGR